MAGNGREQEALASRLIDVFDKESDGPIELDAALLYGSPSIADSGPDSPLGRPWSRGTLEHEMPPQRSSPALDTHLSHRMRPTFQEDQENYADAAPDCAARLDLSSVDGRDKKGADFAALQERLLLKAQERDLKLMKLKADLDRRVLEQCTFQPLLATASRDRILGPDYPSLQSRVMQLQRRREENAARLAQEGAASFQPKLNPRSLVLAERCRLREESTSLSQEQTSTPPSNDPAFEPAINPASVRLLETSSRVPLRFEDRQRYFAELREARLAEEADKKLQAASFQPAVNRAAAVHMPRETLEERTRRMAIEEPSRAEARLRAARQLEAATHTFQPQLNPLSRRLGRKSGLDVLAPAAVPKRALHDEPPAESLGRSSQKAPEALKPPAALLKRLDEQAAKKNAWLEQERRKREQAQLAECTFRPKLSGTIAAVRSGEEVSGASAAAPLPAGMARYLETRRRAAEKKAEEEARIAEVFGLKKSHANRPATVPRPFRLASTARSDALREHTAAKPLSPASSAVGVDPSDSGRQAKSAQPLSRGAVSPETALMHEALFA